MSLAVPYAPGRLPRRPGLPSPRRIGALVALHLAAALASTSLATVAYLRLPSPTGEHGVGRVENLLTDATRIEPTERGGGPRAARLIAWYPAQAGSGEPTGYVPGLERIADGLEASGELPGPVVAGLRFVGTSARTDAAVAATSDVYPVVLLSPGNATNVAFYAGLAEDLASRGFVVIGVDHPYQVAAVDIGDRVAVYREPAERAPGEAVVAKIDERLADLSFVLDRLGADGGGLGVLAGRLDLGRIAVVGHSNGGLAAAGMCADVRVDACANIDGLQAGGPFSARPDPAPPTKPFLFLTKETALHPALVSLFEAGGRDTYRVVVPAATHGAFTDGARFEPRVLPVDGNADHVLAVERELIAAFLDRHLRNVTRDRPFAGLTVPTDVYVEAYPLVGRPTLPVVD